MARNRAFNETAVLDAAGNLFRKRGYLSASIKELEEATGLTSGSIYNAYGDKAGLFRAALNRYVRGFVAARIATHAGDGATLEDLEGLIFTVIEQPLADGYGCLVVNSLVEFGPADSIAREGIDATLQMLRNGIEWVLRLELGDDLAATEATRLMLIYHGVLVLSRGNALPEETARMLRDEFGRLRRLRDERAA